MSPQSSQDPHAESSTDDTSNNNGNVACSPLSAPPDNAANGGSATKESPEESSPPPPSAMTSDDDDGPSSRPCPPPRPPQTTEKAAAGPSTASNANANNTATGLISPLTVLREKPSNNSNDATSSSPTSLLQKMHSHAHLVGKKSPTVATRRRVNVDPSVPRTPQVDSYSISKIGQAREKIKRSFDGSRLLETDEYVFPRFEMDELTLGEVLGRGGFGTVLEIRSIGTTSTTTTTARPEERPKAADSSGVVDDGAAAASPSTDFAGESTVYDLDELDDRRAKRDKHHSKRRRSHGFHFRRRGHHDHRHGPSPGGDHGALLALSHSHDGCEGLTSAASFDGLTSKSDRGPRPRALRSMMSKSFDDLDDGHRDAPAPRLADADDVPRVDSREEGKHRHGRRSRAISWSHAKFNASHFFHRSPKHHHRQPEAEGHGGARHREIEVALGEEKKDSDGDEEKMAEDAEKNTSEDVEHEVSNDGSSNDYDGPEEVGTQGKARQKTCKRVSYAPSIPTSTSEEQAGNNSGSSVRPIRPSKARTFSFLAWRNSEAGEEGSDAFSPEELERYNIDSTLSRSVSVEAFLSDMGANDAEGGGTQGDLLDSDVLPSDPTDEATGDSKSELPVETKVASRGRRIILKSTPKEDGVFHPEKENEIAPGSNHVDQFGVHETKELVTTAVHNAAYYGGHQAKELVTATINNAAYYGGMHQDKAFIAENATTPSGHARYAVKMISPNIVENDFKKFLQAVMDMATETYFLSVLNHPHILKMRAVGQGDMFSPSYFLVLDRLYDTLSDRIEGPWRTQVDHLENSILVWSRARKSRALWGERMSIMKDLAGALRHLHELRIIYRDLKPENVGFDGRGVVKLFDFGLAKECREDDECANGTYKLTPNTGSIRYMAPENGNKWPYNFYADSYSFGILLWEVSSLERPFAAYTPREIRDMVMKWGERPKVNEGWSERVVMLMKQAWDSSFRKRPSMEAIEDTLEKEIADCVV